MRCPRCPPETLGQTFRGECGRRWPFASLVLILVLPMVAGCAQLNDRPPLPSSVAPDPTKAYVYGRFRILISDAIVGAMAPPHLYLQLTNLATGEFVTVHLRERRTEQMYLLDMAPGRYQLTHVVFAPQGAMDMDVKRAPVRVPAGMSFLLEPFQVEAGRVYYVGDWTAGLALEDRHIWMARFKMEWGVYRVALDYVRATAELKRLYPGLGAVDTRAAWRDPEHHVRPRVGIVSGMPDPRTGRAPGLLPGSNESLSWELAGFVLAAKEKTGWKGVSDDDTWRLIYHRQSETSGGWTERVDVTQFPIAVTWASNVRWNPESVMNAEKASMQNAGCSTDVWTVHDKKETSILYEWQNVRCPGRLTQHEIVRIVMGRWYLWFVSYGVRDKTPSPDDRKRMIDHLSEARVVQD